MAVIVHFASKFNVSLMFGLRVAPTCFTGPSSKSFWSAEEEKSPFWPCLETAQRLGSLNFCYPNSVEKICCGTKRCLEAIWIS